MEYITKDARILSKKKCCRIKVVDFDRLKYIVVIKTVINRYITGPKPDKGWGLLNKNLATFKNEVS